MIDPVELLALSRAPGIGPGRLRSLVTHFRGPGPIARTPVRELVRVEGIERKLAAQIVGFYRGPLHGEAVDWARDQLARLERAGARLITLWDTEYPPALKKIYDPPPFVFVSGSFLESDAASVAIVGTRTPSPYGCRVAEEFSRGLAHLGFSVVSGLARGIDTVAHDAALRAGGRSIAVTGSGLDVWYPPENRQLGERISAHGAVVSEYPMRTKPDACNFPRRNRIISGVTRATVVVETGIDGGAMITAAMALDQDREVFAVPGPVSDRRRSGTHLLIREAKAILVESVEDIVAELGAPGAVPHRAPQADRVALSLFEQKLIEGMQERPEHLDVIAARTGLSVSDALVHLLSLEFKSLVRQHPGKYFSLV